MIFWMIRQQISKLQSIPVDESTQTTLYVQVSEWETVVMIFEKFIFILVYRFLYDRVWALLMHGVLWSFTGTQHVTALQRPSKVLKLVTETALPFQKSLLAMTSTRKRFLCHCLVNEAPWSVFMDWVAASFRFTLSSSLAMIRIMKLMIEAATTTNSTSNTDVASITPPWIIPNCPAPKNWCGPFGNKLGGGEVHGHGRSYRLLTASSPAQAKLLNQIWGRRTYEHIRCGCLGSTPASLAISEIS